MKVEMYHASKYGNGEKVVAYLQGLLVAKGHEVGYRHIRDAKPKELPAADLYVFCAPTRIGKPSPPTMNAIVIARITVPASTRKLRTRVHTASTRLRKPGIR